MRRIDGLKLSRLLPLLLVVGVSPALAAQTSQLGVASGPVPVSVRHFEGAVTVQRASAGETSAAIPNLPLDGGDRIWTEGDGRAELMMSDGTTIWLDRRTTVDIVTLPTSATDTSIVRLWGGALLVWRPGETRLAELRIDSGDNVVSLRSAGLSRLDLDDERRLWVSVYDGEALLAAGGMMETIAAGQQSYTEVGTAPARAVLFSTGDVDNFGRWQQDRWLGYAETTRHVAQRDYIPEQVRPYATDLETNGSWFYYDDFGSYAWRPTVSIGWSPYNHGRWVWGYGGWTWASSVSWGWATAHYGRWHHLPSQGWVWFPGGVYRPAWVSWYVGYGHVGWSPIGYYNRPFVSINLWFGGSWGYGSGYHGGYRYEYPRHYTNGGRAVGGQGYARGDSVGGAGWTLIDAADFGRGDASRRAVGRDALPAGAAQNAASLTGTLRQRNVGALAAGRGAIDRTSGGTGIAGTSSGRRALGSTVAGSRSAGRIGPSDTGSRGGLSDSAGARIAVRARPGTGTLNGRPIGGGSDAARGLGQTSTRRPLDPSEGGRTAVTPRAPIGAGSTSRPGGIGSGIGGRNGAASGGTERPSGIARQPIGRSGSGSNLGTTRTYPGRSVTGSTSPYSRPIIAPRTGISSRGAAIGRSGSGARPQITPRTSPGRSAGTSIGSRSSGSRGPASGGTVRGSAAGSRGGSRSAVSRGSVRRRR